MSSPKVKQENAATLDTRTPVDAAAPYGVSPSGYQVGQLESSAKRPKISPSWSALVQAASFEPHTNAEDVAIGIPLGEATPPAAASLTPAGQQMPAEPHNNRPDDGAGRSQPPFRASMISPSSQPDFHDAIGDGASESQPAAADTTPGLTRQFWKAGEYKVQVQSQSPSVSGLGLARLNPKFLHSNATSHKWVLGAIAELLDNSVDEITNGATYVSVDRISNPADGSPMLTVKDNGGGMAPSLIRQCMSFGFSHKRDLSTSIGQYGNGFKTSSMRVAADVLVFTRTQTTQSVGLLSYSYLRGTGQEDIIVPMLDWEYCGCSGVPMASPSCRCCRLEYEPGAPGSDVDARWGVNMAIVALWSPFKSEQELLKQLAGLGRQGTEVIMYNLWETEGGQTELDFDTDPQDVKVRRELEPPKPLKRKPDNAEEYLGFRHSLREYIAILYLELPANFVITLRGTAVTMKPIASCIKYKMEDVYRPQALSAEEEEKLQRAPASALVGRTPHVVRTLVGFAREAPETTIMGFCVYHRNRLIKPFWRVYTSNSSVGRGVIGVLEVGFIEPAHDKQDFERTQLLAKLEARLKSLVPKYWKENCEKIGYQKPDSAHRGYSGVRGAHAAVGQGQGRGADAQEAALPSSQEPGGAATQAGPEEDAADDWELPADGAARERRVSAAEPRRAQGGSSPPPSTLSTTMRASIPATVPATTPASIPASIPATTPPIGSSTSPATTARAPSHAPSQVEQEKAAALVALEACQAQLAASQRREANLTALTELLNNELEHLKAHDGHPSLLVQKLAEKDGIIEKLKAENHQLRKLLGQWLASSTTPS